MTIKLTKGRINNKGIAIVLMGEPGWGKTTLASHIPGAIILDAEDGSRLIESATRTPVPKNEDDIYDYLKDLGDGINEYGLKTLVVDSIDAVETILCKSMLTRNNKNSIEDFGYGKGYNMLSEEIKEFINVMDWFRSKGVNVLLISHVAQIHIDNPDTMDSYDGFAISLSKKSRPIVTQWADAILYGTYQVNVINTDRNGHGKAVPKQTRILYTQASPAHPDCKNRFGLEAKVPGTYESIKQLFE